MADSAPKDDPMFRERVLRARQIPPGKRLMMGPELFEYACRITLSGIRAQNPDATEDECRKELSRRIAMVRKMEEAGLYRDVEPDEAGAE